MGSSATRSNRRMALSSPSLDLELSSATTGLSQASGNPCDNTSCGFFTLGSPIQEYSNSVIGAEQRSGVWGGTDAAYESQLVLREHMDRPLAVGHGVSRRNAPARSLALAVL